MSSQQTQHADSCTGCNDLKAHFEKVTADMAAKIDEFEKQIQELSQMSNNSVNTIKAPRQKSAICTLKKKTLTSVLNSVENIPPVVESFSLKTIKSEAEDDAVHESLKEDETQKLLAIISAQFDAGIQSPNVSTPSTPIVTKNNGCCTNCLTPNSSTWRRDENGNRLCNSCGVYRKKHKMNRPVQLHNKPLRKRPRHSKAQETEAFNEKMMKINLSELDSSAGVSPTDFFKQLNQLMKAEPISD